MMDNFIDGITWPGLDYESHLKSNPSFQSSWTTSTSLEIDLFSDFAKATRQSLGSQGFSLSRVQDDDRAAIMLYCKMQRYAIEDRPRKIYKAATFQCPSHHQIGLLGLEKAIQTGSSLKPYRSKQIDNTGYDDGLFDHWKTHHFHLGTKLGEDGFVERTNELLFSLIGDDSAYFIKIAPHNSSPWAKKDLITTIHANWPDVLNHYLVKGIDRLEHDISDGDRKSLRDAHVMTFLEMEDGTVYIEPGIGRTLGGLHVQDLQKADELKRIASWVERTISENWEQISDNARRQGYHLKPNASLSLCETVPHLYWDILDRESGYRFRQPVI